MEVRVLGMYLNSRMPFEAFKAVSAGKYFVDKSEILQEIIPSMGTEERFFCITRPRRFGKTVTANMIAAFFGKAADIEAAEAAKMIFQGLKIGSFDGFQEYLHQYEVISIDFSRVSRDCTSYGQYMKRIQDGLNQDLMEAFPDFPEHRLSIQNAVWDNLQAIFEKTKTRFVFVFDEWDALFHMDFANEGNKKDFLRFLRSLLKGQAYVEFAYMTGVLPIAKYSSGSELNMFKEYDMTTKKKFCEYFGFSDAEVDQLFAAYQRTSRNGKITREELAEWYDGYFTAAGNRLYNPRSIVCALTDDQIGSYWTSSGPYDEIFYYIRNNIEDVRDDLVLMIAGECVVVKLQGYAAVSTELITKNQIYSAMVVYGLLTYENGAVSIPNRELMEKFNELLLTKDSLGYVHHLAKESEKMLKATLRGNTDTMAEILKYAHDTESPIFSYNSEFELSAVVYLVYLAARDRYRVEREDKAGEGFVDFIFYPEYRNEDALILELKIDSTPEEAIEQIKNKRYVLRFRGKLGEREKYTGRVLAVGISYDRKTKEHFCGVEVI